MNLNLEIIIKKYGNDHTLKNFKGRTPYIESNGCYSEGSDGGSKETTPK